MRKLFLLLLVLCVVVNARTWQDSIIQNWNGWEDTLAVNDTLDSATVYYSESWRLTDGEDIRVILLVDDTGETGFADDSVNFMWGYQTGNPIINGSGNLDTAWDDRIFVDSMQGGSFGSATVGSVDSTGALTRSLGSIDTTNVTGFAYQTRWIVPEWDVLCRFWYSSLGALQADAKALKMYFAIKRRIYVQMRKK